MERRKFLIGAGALASGSAAAMGTGAFASTSTQRNLSVETAADANAYLGLISESAYSEQTGSTLSLQFDGSNSNQRGNGLNVNSDTQFRNVFSVRNQGTNAIRVQFYKGDNGSFGGGLEDTPLAIGVSDDEISYSSNEDGENGINDIETAYNSLNPGTWGGGGSAVASAQDIEPGDKTYVHMGFFLNDQTQTLGSGTTDLDDVPGSLQVYAEAAPEEDPL